MRTKLSFASFATLATFAVLFAVACRQTNSKVESKSGSGAAATPLEAAPKDIDSKEILARTELAPQVFVKDVLISWKGLQVYAGHQDPRGAARTNDQAAAVALEVLGKLQASPASIDELVATTSEDPKSQSGEPFEIKTDTNFTPELKALALRLKENEAGVVKSMFGYHVVERIVPKPDPVESVDILARNDFEKGTVYVQYVLIGWKGGWPGARGATRTKAEADALAKEVLAKMKAGADMPKLMKEFSEDPNSKDDGKVYEVSPTTPLIQPFKNLALRLKMAEAGIVKSPYGFHVMKRVAPPPYDKLESADILRRAPLTSKARVKQILLGWTNVHDIDPRGTARSRAELEALVQQTVAKLKQGEKIEPLMKELSEDSNSAPSGGDYEVTPAANLVEPFKNLSFRLKVGEVGVVKTRFGISIIQRTE